MIPQIIFLSLIVISIALNVYAYVIGAKKGKSILVEIVSHAVTLALLFWGGFFDPLFK